ncbi:BON domain-containing protein [Micromonospora sp. WMMD882]|nr:BON domain-containing protein [Micromonospora sp. WMMD882]WBB79779.1 BON domain-containing protein [Micromonospora sp. WMMD882]
MRSATTIRVDQDIQAQVRAELAGEPGVRPHEVGVSVADGVVTLSGWVDAYAKRWAAERAAHRAARVRAVANDLAVRPSASTGRTGPELAAAVGHALEWEAFLPLDELDVTVADGWVTLRGRLDWEYQRRAAESAVRRLPGVRGVGNQIRVRPRPEPPRAGEPPSPAPPADWTT